MNPRSNSGRKPSPAASDKALPAWFHWSLAILGLLVVFKLLGLQVFFEISYDGGVLLTALTDLKTYFVPLLLILVYILVSWAWGKIAGSRDSRQKFM